MNYKLKTVLIILTFFLSKPFFINAQDLNRNQKDKFVTVGNKDIRFNFDISTGELLAFSDLTNSIEILDNQNEVHNSPWEITLEKNSVVKKLNINSARIFHFSKINDKTLQLEWSDFSIPSNPSFKVTVNVKVDDDKPFSEWHISITGIQSEKIEKVAFPKINGIKDMGNERLAVPVWMGQIMENPRQYLSQIKGGEKKFEWAYPGPLSMQFLALYNKKTNGLYVACDDTLAYAKKISLVLDTLNDLSYQVDNYPSFDSTLNSYAPPYHAIIGLFKGDWINAANLYQDWGSKQSWCSESRLKNGLTPLWLKNTALWVWNRGKSGNVLVPAIELKKRLGLPVSVLWHWWHGCSYDDGFPEYFPPREGSTSFLNALSNAQKEGVKAIVYMNSFQWGDSTKSWKAENAAISAVKDINGKMITHVYNTFTGHPLTAMCMATQFWKDKYSGLADSAINIYHTGGVYMDQACLNFMCYDKNHGHSIGGGNYWVDNFGRLTNQIRNSASQKNQPILAGEGCGEAWLPYLDAFLTLQVSKERYAGIGEWETIPLFQAVYHQYGITYGNYSSLVIPPYDELWPKKYAPKNPNQLLDEKFNKQFLMEQARSFVWGMQPTIANYQSFLASARKDEINYLLNLARVRNSGLKYLLYGKFLRSPTMVIPKEKIKISKLSIYAGQDEKVTTFEKEEPLIYSATWKANDGQVGIAIASISDTRIRVNLNFNAHNYELPKSGKIFIIDSNGRKMLNSYSGGIVHVDYSLPSKELCIIEITPKS
ncbi:MAG: DUF6259 domain-containing protein [Ginsengibacter sp.]